MNHTPIILSDTTFTRKLTRVGLAATAIGGALSLIAALTNWERFIFNYLVAFALVAGIAVTSVFFSTLMYLVRSGWSTAVRRIPEFIGGFVPYLIVLLVPVFFGLGTLYHHWMHPEATDVIIAGKAQWLNPTFFTIRLVLYCALWSGMYFFIVGNSFKQDTSSDPTPTKRNWIFSAPITIVYAISITFAAFDLLMSLTPHWYSTIFGVYYFAGSLVGTLAVISIIMILLKKAGLFTEWLAPARFHDLGKLLFAFNVFWAYIAFSQYMLMWYANLPEEITFFKTRFMNGWEYVSYLLVVVHFFVPFILLLSQASKRNLNVLLAGAVILLGAHIIDLYWIVMPSYSLNSVPLGWIELVPLIGLGGLFLLFLSMRFKKKNLLPVNDPFLAEAQR